QLVVFASSGHVEHGQAPRPGAFYNIDRRSDISAGSNGETPGAGKKSGQNPVDRPFKRTNYFTQTPRKPTHEDGKNA
ncbi:MAG TPA: hypothetical protein VKJ77_03035, partial [Caballeronia sp.]|nr:hypothetical protein [Caballeronia sp.]